MKLTKLKLLVMTLLCAMSLNAQEAVENVQEEEEKVKRSHELGLNLTALAEFVFDRTANQELASPYLFTYKLMTRSEKWALRFGLGGDVNTSSDPEDERKAYNNEYDFRVGIEKSI